MTPSTPKTFTNITPEKIDQIRTQGKSKGVDLKAEKGQADYDHCQIAYEYDPDAQTLMITPSLPFYVSENEFWGHLSAWLQLIPA